MVELEDRQAKRFEDATFKISNKLIQFSSKGAHLSSTAVNQFEFLLLDGFSNLVLASALEPLRDVKMRAIFADVAWEILSLDGGSIHSSSGIEVVPERRFDHLKTGGTLVIVAGYRVREQSTKEFSSLIRRAVRRRRRILALDAAPWILAAAGVLDGHKATIHWQEKDEFQEAFPRVEVSNARFVRSGSFMTCGGASSAFEMILDLVQEMFGPAAAFDASSMFVFDPVRQKNSDYGSLRLPERGSSKLLSALDLIAENIESPLTTFELAERVGLSERSLSRAFARELGMTPGKYYKIYRLRHAQYLCEETRLTAEQVALRCGFSCASALRRSFASEFGRPFRTIHARQTHLRE